MKSSSFGVVLLSLQTPGIITHLPIVDVYAKLSQPGEAFRDGWYKWVQMFELKNTDPAYALRLVRQNIAFKVLYDPKGVPSLLEALPGIPAKKDTDGYLPGSEIVLHRPRMLSDTKRFISLWQWHGTEPHYAAGQQGDLFA